MKKGGQKSRNTGIRMIKVLNVTANGQEESCTLCTLYSYVSCSLPFPITRELAALVQQITGQDGRIFERFYRPWNACVHTVTFFLQSSKQKLFFTTMFQGAAYENVTFQ